VDELPPPDETAARLLRERPAFAHQLAEVFRTRRDLLRRDQHQRTALWLFDVLEELDRHDPR
jgi:hypothetical protein